MPGQPTHTYQSPILLVGGGHMAWESFDQIKHEGYPIIAVDAGADILHERGIDPHLILGDMDSPVRPSPTASSVEKLKIDEQDTTDFEKALYSLDAPLYLAFGFWGKRLDHSLAALHAMTKYRNHRQIILVDDIDLLYVPRGPFQMSSAPDTRISVIPLNPVSFLASEGLKYPLDGLTLEMGAAIGVSNEITGEAFSITPAASEQNNYGIIMPAQNLKPMVRQIAPS